uniref:Na+/H+ antiporter NhaC family protein n=1 Tax=Ndongobacter massiliensis TaxID=1871025 RepID=UPI000931C055|nr:Na+/H+ antiporter NhaC family protein [Ndongobacter massiliensis]
MNTKKTERISGVALLPFLIFVGIYLAAGIILSIQGVEMAFYAFPVLVACLIGIMCAFVLHPGTMGEKFDAFTAGMGNTDIMTMCMIYMLAGAFAASTSAMGGAESTINLALSLIPAQFLIAGVFLVGAFLSLAMGTSMGTIGALGPIAIGLANAANLNLGLTLGAVLGGAMFGDNLSVISDTTIAATKTQNVEMKDKFNLNFKLALPAAVLTFVLLLIFGRPEVAPQTESYTYDIVKVLPYLFVLIAALVGVNVFVVLAGGIVFSVVIGIATGSFDFLTAVGSMNDGFMGMAEIYILSMFVGGLAEMVRRAGGINWLLNRLSRSIKSRAGGEIGVSVLVSAVDIACANNTVAIVLAGPIAKQLSNRFKIDPRRVASLLDTFSCIFQGIIPYGAQMLLALKLSESGLSPFAVIPNVWYVFFLAILAIVSIFVPFADGVCRKDPWNFEYDCPESKVEAKKASLANEADFAQ